MIPVGKFARMCQVSIRTLHYYDQIGLLHPAYVDEASGFRYYEIDQMDTLLKIARCKRFGFTLGEIACLDLDHPENNRELFCRKEQHLISKIHELQTSLQDLRVMMERAERKTDTMSKPKSVFVDCTETKTTPIFSLRRKMGVGDFGQAYSELYDAVMKANVRPGLRGARYFDEEFDSQNSDIEVFVTLDEADLAKATALIDDSLCAHATHHGGYSTLNETYNGIARWVFENGYELTGAPYELYTSTGFENPDPATWITEVYFPIRKAD